MKKIFYSLAGEGLGHCSRFLALLDFCPKEWEIHAFTWGEAYDFLKKQNYPHLHQVDSLPFGRVNGKISVIKTAFNTIKYCGKFVSSYKYALKTMRQEQPDLCISDCEGIVPRVARKLRIPCISIDNQHRFSRCFSVDLPFYLRMWSWAMGLFAEWLVPYPKLAIVSIFYHAKIKKMNNKTVITNCFMRKQMEDIEPTNGDYILVYYKSSCGPKILELLSKTNEKVKIYGHSNVFMGYEICPNFEYCNIDNDNFIRDLAGCKALFCSSGNQLLGEAVYYGKNIFTVPEPKQPEQYINAFCLKQMGFGEFCYWEDLDNDKVWNFLNSLKDRKPNGINGSRQAVDVIKKVLK